MSPAHALSLIATGEGMYWSFINWWVLIICSFQLYASFGIFFLECNPSHFFIFAPIFYVEICLLPLKVQIYIFLVLVFAPRYIHQMFFCPCNLRILNKSCLILLQSIGMWVLTISISLAAEATLYSPWYLDFPFDCYTSLTFLDYGSSKLKP